MARKQSISPRRVSVPCAVITTVGKKKYPNRDEYVGDMTKDGLRHGKGTMRYANGTVYDGEWKEDKWEGQGKYIGTEYSYEGEFSDNSFHGFGRMFWFRSRDSYEGEFLTGERNGTGTYKWASGASYTGLWENGRKHGKGVYTYPDGTVYDGSFDSGWHCGEAVIRTPRGIVVERKTPRETPRTARSHRLEQLLIAL
eukprot:TRINITY_DN2699_c0_g1_i1.p1 TRINITY_DN2699_c0_g1~~TRINITY_DN2699_c0_g1_i1.p1  ORF type:complete len:197 (+),score=16.21 TRINITY_DN2699_c0_g1_i1:171-761(+)